MTWWDTRDRLPYLSISRDHGRTWSTPLLVAPPGVFEVNFPTITAGDAGRIAIHFPGSTSAERTSTRPWNTYLMVSTNALDPEPLFTWTTANDPADPVRRGDCGPGRCGGMFDFLDIQTSPANGAFWAAAVDTCTNACITGDGPSDAADGFAISSSRGHRSGPRSIGAASSSLGHAWRPLTLGEAAAVVRVRVTGRVAMRAHAQL